MEFFTALQGVIVGEKLSTECSAITQLLVETSPAGWKPADDRHADNSSGSSWHSQQRVDDPQTGQCVFIAEEVGYWQADTTIHNRSTADPTRF